MAKKRIHEIAKDQGLTSKEVIERLAQSGIEGKVAVSTIEEDVALEVLNNGRAPGTAPAAPWDEEPDGPAEASPNGAAAARAQGGPLFWLKTVSLVLLKGDGKAPTAPGARVGYRAPGRPSTSRQAPEAPPLRLPPASHLRAGAVALLAAAGVVGLAAWRIGAFDSGSQQKQQLPPRAVARPLTPVQRQDAGLGHFGSVVAGVRDRSIAIYRSPRRLHPYTRLSNPNADGAPLVFLVKQRTPQWLQVYLPTRPNGSVGWIRRHRVSLAGHNYRVKIDLPHHRLTAWNGRSVIANVSIGVGRAVTPTPAGLYYITELLQQPEPDGPYGPFAFGLSVHSDILHEFEGADGILGIHGTNDPGAIGTDVSHGCIRMTNGNITRLAHTLPAGTPVRIVD
jgi:lipoprotein-anchoring transpeptidase ErfK/SrfK